VERRGLAGRHAERRADPPGDPGDRLAVAERPRRAHVDEPREGRAHRVDAGGVGAPRCAGLGVEERGPGRRPVERGRRQPEVHLDQRRIELPAGASAERVGQVVAIEQASELVSQIRDGDHPAPPPRCRRRAARPAAPGRRSARRSRSRRGRPRAVARSARPAAARRRRPPDGGRRGSRARPGPARSWRRGARGCPRGRATAGRPRPGSSCCRTARGSAAGRCRRRPPPGPPRGRSRCSR
jgi:hypothetical protein